jgi:hypothetical protein
MYVIWFHLLLVLRPYRMDETLQWHDLTPFAMVMPDPDFINKGRSKCKMEQIGKSFAFSICARWQLTTFCLRNPNPLAVAHFNCREGTIVELPSLLSIRAQEPVLLRLVEASVVISRPSERSDVGAMERGLVIFLLIRVMHLFGGTCPSVILSNSDRGLIGVFVDPY